jgi:hypothetical protein
MSRTGPGLRIRGQVLGGQRSQDISLGGAKGTSRRLSATSFSSWDSLSATFFACAGAKTSSRISGRWATDARVVAAGGTAMTRTLRSVLFVALAAWGLNAAIVSSAEEDKAPRERERPVPMNGRRAAPHELLRGRTFNRCSSFSIPIATARFLPKRLMP